MSDATAGPDDTGMKTEQPRRSTNPRTARVCEIIVDAASGLLLQEGAGAVTAVRIAERTGVARTTIYRHFEGPSELLLAAIDRVVTPHVPTQITDDLEADLVAALCNLGMRMERNPFRLVFTALLDHANRDEGLLAAQRRFVDGVLQPVRDVLSAGVERGALPATVRLEAASARLAGPLFLQHIMLRSPIGEQLIHETITQFLAGGRGSD